MVVKPLMSTSEKPFIAFIQEGVVMDIVQPGAVPLPPIDTVIQQPVAYEIRKKKRVYSKEGMFIHEYRAPVMARTG